jgi:hypothetical protein
MNVFSNITIYFIFTRVVAAQWCPGIHAASLGTGTVVVKNNVKCKKVSLVV